LTLEILDWFLFLHHTHIFGIIYFIIINWNWNWKVNQSAGVLFYGFSACVLDWGAGFGGGRSRICPLLIHLI